MDPFIPYIAGFIDGEGYIYIRKTGTNGTYASQYMMQLVISNTDPRPLLLMKQRWGGHFVLIKRNNEDQRDIYRIHLSIRNAYDCLKQCLPYLLVKREQAQLAIEFYEYTEHCRSTYRHVKGKKGVQAFPPESHVIRDNIVLRLRELTKRGRVPGIEQVDVSTLLATGLSTTFGFGE